MKRTEPWLDSELCYVGTVPCVYVGPWGDKCHVMLPGHRKPLHRDGGNGYTLLQLKLMGYHVTAPRIPRPCRYG